MTPADQFRKLIQWEIMRLKAEHRRLMRQLLGNDLPKILGLLIVLFLMLHYDHEIQNLIYHAVTGKDIPR